jgi:hypothetical protein
MPVSPAPGRSKILAVEEHDLDPRRIAEAWKAEGGKTPLNRSRKGRFRLTKRALQDKKSNRATAAPDAQRDSFMTCTKNAA